MKRNFKKSFESGVVVHIFSSIIPQAEAGSCLSSRPAWSIEEISRQPSLGSDRNHQKQKPGENTFELGVHVPTAASPRTWHLQSHNTGQVKNTRKGLYSLPPLLRKANETRCKSCMEAQRGHCIKLRRLLWRPQGVGEARVMGCLPKKAAKREKRHLKERRSSSQYS